MISELDYLTAAIVADPSNDTAWAMYSDCCLECGREDWADHGLATLKLDSLGRRDYLARHREGWPLAAKLVPRVDGWEGCTPGDPRRMLPTALIIAEFAPD